MSDSSNALKEAIEAGDLSAVRELIAQHPARLRDAPGPGENVNFRPMNVAAVNCQTEILAYLISEGGDVMENSNFPLCRAATRGGCVPTMELLIDHGADVNSDIIDQHGGKDHNSALHNVSAKGDTKGVRLLLEHGADPKATNNKGMTPIDVARNKRVRDLLEKAQDVS